MKTLSYLIKSISTLLLLSSLVLISFNSHAGRNKVADIVTYTPISNIAEDNGIITVSVSISASNECASNNAYFDDVSGFSNCRIYIDDGGERKYLADVIAKFGTKDDDSSLEIGYGEYEESTKYKTLVESNMWTFDTTGENKTGTWVYNNANDYPDIRYWIAKAGGGKNGSGFRLFWTIENNDDGYCKQGIEGNDSVEHNLNFECMNLAQSVTTGDWTTPANKGLSHITFFGGMCSVNCDDPATAVPEPSTLIIFTLGLLGLGIRRKQNIKTKK
jgi:hypothetical protein